MAQICTGPGVLREATLVGVTRDDLVANTSAIQHRKTKGGSERERWAAYVHDEAYLPVSSGETSATMGMEAIEILLQVRRISGTIWW